MLRAALRALDESAVMRSALGDTVVEHYLHVGRWEQAEYDRRVTDWEVIRNFERGWPGPAIPESARFVAKDVARGPVGSAALITSAS